MLSVIFFFFGSGFGAPARAYCALCSVLCALCRCALCSRCVFCICRPKRRQRTSKRRKCTDADTAHGSLFIYQSQWIDPGRAGVHETTAQRLRVRVQRRNLCKQKKAAFPPAPPSPRPFAHLCTPMWKSWIPNRYELLTSASASASGCRRFWK